MSRVAEPKDLLEVLSRMEFWKQEPPEQSKRQFRRFPVRCEALLRDMADPRDEQASITAMIRDISRGGVGFVTEQFIDPGTTWRVEFTSAGTDNPHVIGTQPIIVRYCRLVQIGLYLCGGQFVVEPYIMRAVGVSEQDMQGDFLGHFHKQDTAEFKAPEEIDD